MSHGPWFFDEHEWGRLQLAVWMLNRKGYVPTVSFVESVFGDFYRLELE